MQGWVLRWDIHFPRYNGLWEDYPVCTGLGPWRTGWESWFSISIICYAISCLAKPQPRPYRPWLAGEGFSTYASSRRMWTTWRTCRQLIIHLHGELMKSCSVNNLNKGLSYLSEYPESTSATRIRTAFVRSSSFRELFPTWNRPSAKWRIAIGSSLNVYPAAGWSTTFRGRPIFLIDPKDGATYRHDIISSAAEPLKSGTSEGVAETVEGRRQNASNLGSWEMGWLSPSVKWVFLHIYNKCITVGLFFHQIRRHRYARCISLLMSCCMRMMLFSLSACKPVRQPKYGAFWLSNRTIPITEDMRTSIRRSKRHFIRTTSSGSCISISSTATNICSQKGELMSEFLFVRFRSQMEAHLWIQWFWWKRCSMIRRPIRWCIGPPYGTSAAGHLCRRQFPQLVLAETVPQCRRDFGIIRNTNSYFYYEDNSSSSTSWSVLHKTVQLIEMDE